MADLIDSTAWQPGDLRDDVAPGEVINRSVTPPIQWVVLVSSTGGDLRCLLGEGTPNTTEGYGGWETIDRPRDLPIVEWTNQPAFRQDLPLLLNGWGKGNSVEGQIARVESFARPIGPGREPPSLKVFFPGNQPRSWRMNWVVESIEWGDAERLANGRRVRQWVTLALLQRVNEEALISPAKQRRDRGVGTSTITTTGGVGTSTIST